MAALRRVAAFGPVAEVLQPLAHARRVLRPHERRPVRHFVDARQHVAERLEGDVVDVGRSAHHRLEQLDRVEALLAGGRHIAGAHGPHIGAGDHGVHAGDPVATVGDVPTGSVKPLCPSTAGLLAPCMSRV